MINAKVKIFYEDLLQRHQSAHTLENVVNDFLKTIDVRQIIKTEYSTCVAAGQYNTIRSHSAVIYYVEYEDIRDAKIDNVLEIK
jgi:hypothetical protein